MYDDTNPDWTPSLHLGYDAAVPDEARYNRLQQRNTRRVSTVESEDGEAMETGNTMYSIANYISELHAGIACQTEKAELCDAECQTDKDSTELTVAQKKELLQLRKENLHLKEELEKKTSIDIFSEEFLMKEENQHTLKFYTGTYNILLLLFS